MERAAWVAMKGQDPRPFHHCHVENFPFEDALRIFEAKSTRFKATVGSPRSGREFMLQLPTGRCVLIKNYDDFPYSLEFSVEIKDRKDGRGKPVAYLKDLRFALEPLGFAVPDKSNDGFIQWRPTSEA